MFRDSPKLIAASAFLAGGVLVGGITLGTSVAHGAGTGSGGTGQSDAQYTAKHAWEQSVQMTGSANVDVGLNVPTGERLTITAVLAGGQGFTEPVTCFLDTIVSGTSSVVNVTVLAEQQGSNPNGSTGIPFQPVFAETNSGIACDNPGVAGYVNVIGYLTPITAS